MTVETQQVHGDDLAYETHAGTGTPLVLVHGVGSSSQTWAELIPLLQTTGHPIIAIDLLGHGRSGAGNGDYSLSANASRIRDLLDLLGIDDIHLIGHSLGGGVCMQFHYLFPQRTSSLTLISSGGLGEEVTAGLRAASLPGSEVVFRMLTSDKGINALQRTRKTLTALGIRGVEANTIEKFRRLQDERRLRGFLATVRSVVGPQGQLVSALDKFDAMDDPRSILIIWGDRDSSVPMAHGRRAHELLPGSEFLVVPGAGHHPHVDAPDRVAAAISNHVARFDHV